jgi:hypothetical protein
MSPREASPQGSRAGLRLLSVMGSWVRSEVSASSSASDTWLQRNCWADICSALISSRPLGPDSVSSTVRTWRRADILFPAPVLGHQSSSAAWGKGRGGKAGVPEALGCPRRDSKPWSCPVRPIAAATLEHLSQDRMASSGGAGPISHTGRLYEGSLDLGLTTGSCALPACSIRAAKASLTWTSLTCQPHLCQPHLPASPAPGAVGDFYLGKLCLPMASPATTVLCLPPPGHDTWKGRTIGPGDQTVHHYVHLWTLGLVTPQRPLVTQQTVP